MYGFVINSLPTSVVFWVLLQSVWTQSDPTKCRIWSGSKLVDTLIVFLKEFFEKDNFEKKSADNDKSMENTQHAKC